jgi:hypothetical protein
MDFMFRIMTHVYYNKSKMIHKIQQISIKIRPLYVSVNPGPSSGEQSINPGRYISLCTFQDLQLGLRRTARIGRNMNGQDMRFSGILLSVE